MIDALCLLVGVFVGAWLTYRAQRGQSPLPELPEQDEPADESQPRPIRL
jgi:hypothetical protein